MITSLKQYGVKLAYEKLDRIGDKLEPFQKLID